MISFEELVLGTGLPIYLQIVLYVKRGMVAGTIRNGDEMPSRRVLSALLGVNPNTIQKAYGILETNGILCSVKGKGSFISGDENAEAVVLVRAKANFREAVAKARGIPKNEIYNLVNRD